VLDEQVLAAIRTTPRDFFVPEPYRGLAYADEIIPLAHGQEMFLPWAEANMIQSLQIKPTDRVLEVGTGTGYVTALLAKLANDIYSVDIFPDFSAQASERLRHLNLNNVTFNTGDASRGWVTNAPYDVIVVSGSMELLPEEFLQQLQAHGRLFAILGTAPAMIATRWLRRGPSRVEQTSLFETVTPRLVHAVTKEPFVF
jgi:protein-L-isoaspartate(D-aspartate) O-methyltransferase